METETGPKRHKAETGTNRHIQTKAKNDGYRQRQGDRQRLTDTERQRQTERQRKTEAH